MSADRTVHDGGTAAAAAGAAAWVLALMAATQFVLQLDMSIVNVALATVQRELHFSASGLQWVVTGYALTFGALLLVAGRVGDITGHRRALVAGLVVFAITSLTGGLAQSPVMLVISRLVQGASAAAVAPAALALITHAYTEPAARARALGIFSGAAAAGGTAGIVFGGILTEYAGWRWVLLVNPPVIVVLIAFVLRRMPADAGHAAENKVDLPGAVLATAAIAGLILGVTEGEQHGFDGAASLCALVAAVVLAVAFVVVERRSEDPMLPGTLLVDRRRRAALGVVLLLGAVFVAYIYFASLYMQRVLDHSPVESGLSFLPATATAFTMSTVVARRAMPRVGIPRLMIFSMLLLAAGQLWFSQATADGSYLANVLPAMLLSAAGIGLAFPTAAFAISADVPPHQRGVAGGMFVTAQQVGGAVGLAVLASAAAARTAHTHTLVGGYRLSYAIATGLALLAAAGVALTISPRQTAEVPQTAD